MMVDQRLLQLDKWLQRILKGEQYTLKPLVTDASFRRYFRVHQNGETYVVMDAPIDKENPLPFMKVGLALAKLGIKVPLIFANDLEQGFLLLSDLGDCLYLQALTNGNADVLYQRAIDTLLTIQTCQQVPDFDLPTFDKDFINQELTLFAEWFLIKQLRLNLSAKEQQLLQETFENIAAVIGSQPQIFIHRDYHSRNLMLLDDNQVGVLDFQDAMWGPCTYDIVSLLRDCYVTWPNEQVRAWALFYQRKAHQAKIIDLCDDEQFLYWFDWTGIQRHMKAIGIFARLNLRDNKSLYLSDIPRALTYILETANNYPELEHFKCFLQNKVLPELPKLSGQPYSNIQ